MAGIAGGGTDWYIPAVTLISKMSICLSYLAKKWECPDKITVEGGWGFLWGRSCCPVPVKALLNLTFNLANSAKKSLILPRGSKMRERHWPPPRAVPPKREFL
ncbi:MAG: hypothetical protein ACRCYT_06490, partial [Cetobacterium sp.]